MFLDTLGQACEKTDWQVHAWCLMKNHFHLVVETPRANLVDGMKWFLGTYTSRFNRRHKYFGHLFSGRYKALLVDGSTTGYFKSVCDYVHLNPVRAKLLGADDKLTAFRWSSFGEYLKPRTQRPAWLQVERLLGEWGVPKDTSAGRAHFERMVETRRKSEDPDEAKKIQRGWCYGSEEFRQELLEQMESSFGAHHAGAEKQESAQAKAERILGEELARLQLRAPDLERARKGDRRKLKIALRLRQETTMSWDWIAGQLAMGTGGSAANAARAATEKK
jgi:REP element-mobilizing transposase RayT